MERVAVDDFTCVTCGETKSSKWFPPTALRTNTSARRCLECPTAVRRDYTPRVGKHSVKLEFDLSTLDPEASEVPKRCPRCGGYIKVEPYPSNHAMGYGGWKCVNCGRGQV